MTDLIHDVLVPGGHGRTGPAHDRHHRPLGHTKQEEDGRGRVASSVEAPLRYTGLRE